MPYLAFTVAMAVSAGSSRGLCKRKRICTLVIVFTISVRHRSQIVAVAHHHGGQHQDGEAGGQPSLSAHAGAAPFMQRDAPETAEDDDTRHVERPTGKLVP